jgi:hypothetical protein
MDFHRYLLLRSGFCAIQMCSSSLRNAGENGREIPKLVQLKSLAF